MTKRPPTKPRKQPRQERSKATVDAILDATARILVSEGYRAASTNRVAEVAGISIGSLYQYFPSKTALVTAVRRRHAEQMRTLLLHSVASATGAPLETAAKSLVDAVVAAHMLNPKLHKVLEEEVPHPAAGGNRDDLGNEMLGALCQILEHYRDELIPTDLELTSLLLMQLVEALVHSVVINPPTTMDPEKIKDEILTIVVRYLKGLSGHQSTLEGNQGR
jgi:AcrR family transcriptional regulator